MNRVLISALLSQIVSFLPTDPSERVAVCTLTNEPALIVDFVVSNLLAGCSHFIVVDNSVNQTVTRTLDGFWPGEFGHMVSRVTLNPSVTRAEPGANWHRLAHAECLRVLDEHDVQGDHEWLAIIDADEHLTVVDESVRSVGSVLADMAAQADAGTLPGCAGFSTCRMGSLSLRWTVMSNGGTFYPNPFVRSLGLRYPWRCGPQAVMVKTVYRIPGIAVAARPFPLFDPHWNVLRRGYIPFDEDGTIHAGWNLSDPGFQPEIAGKYSDARRDRLTVTHYFARSIVDIVHKIRRGDAYLGGEHTGFRYFVSWECRWCRYRAAEPAVARVASIVETLLRLAPPPPLSPCTADERVTAESRHPKHVLCEIIDAILAEEVFDDQFYIANNAGVLRTLADRPQSSFSDSKYTTAIWHWIEQGNNQSQYRFVKPAGIASRVRFEDVRWEEGVTRDRLFLGG